MTILTNKPAITYIFEYGLTTVLVKKCNIKPSKHAKVPKILLMIKNQILAADYKD